MFIPLGFGNWPRQFPIMTILLATICVVWSVHFFPSVDKADEEMATTSNVVEHRRKLVRKVVFDTCAARTKDIQECHELNDYIENKKRSPATEKNKERETKVEDEDFFGPLALYMDLSREFAQDMADWPEEAQRSPAYSELMAIDTQHKERQQEIVKRYGFLSRNNFHLHEFLRATFTHDGWAHLIGNLVFLIFMGVWVEQRAGRLATLLIFTFGSFVGFFMELMFKPETSVLGASAGVTGLMGAFFIFFHHTEVRFLFNMFVYFRVISLPAVWTFPFFYFLGDFAMAAAQSGGGVAHHAHLGGLVTGFLIGYAIHKVDRLQTDELFAEERRFVEKLKRAENSDSIWKYFKGLMKWNSQNWNGIKMFLNKSHQGLVSFDNHAQNKWLQKILRYSTQHFLKRSTVDDMSTFIRTFPPSLDLVDCLADTPLSQVLFIADRLANDQEYYTARRLYAVALEKKPDVAQAEAIRSALQTIDNISLQRSS